VVAGRNDKCWRFGPIPTFRIDTVNLTVRERCKAEIQ
jgi:hypothetical protein